jgi:hypothetical protein
MPTIEERRRAPRFNASLNVFLSEGEARYVVETENVSVAGLCLRSIKVFPVGTQLHLVFGRPPELPPLIAEGIVRWSEGGKGVGVEFTSISPDDRLALLRFVNLQSRREQA